MKYLDFQFGIASANGDHKAMKRFAKQLAELINDKELPYEEIVHGAS
jgi:hypothetical protein